MLFNLENTAIYQGIKWEKHPVFLWLNPLKNFFLIAFIALLILFIYGFFFNTISDWILSLILGFSVLSLTFFLTYWLRELFLNARLKNPRLNLTIKDVLADPQKYNLAEFLSFDLAKAVLRSIKLAKSKKLSEINSTILFYSLLLDSPQLNFVFSRALLDLKEIKKLLKVYINGLKGEKFCEFYSEDFENAVLEAFYTAEKKGHLRIEVGDILPALAKYDLIFKKILIDNKLKVEDINNLTWWIESLEERVAKSKKFWEWSNLVRKGSLAKTWASGYSITLDKFSFDLSEIVKKQRALEIVSHKKEIENMERVLSRQETNNCLLVGEPGVGKKTIILNFARRSVFGEGLKDLYYKKIVQLDLSTLLAQLENREDIESVLHKIFDEVVAAGNIILVIDEFHNFVGGTERPGVIDITGVLSSYLPLPQFQLIGLTSYVGLHKYIEQRPAVLSLFEKVEVAEVSKIETLMVLENLALTLEQKYKKFISFSALREIIILTDKYLPDTPFPKSALDLLDEVMVYMSSIKDKIVLPKHVDKIVTEKTAIPVGEIESKEKDILLNLENLLHERIINQEKGVREVSAALRRARTEVTARKGPMGSFLFLGPTGVGKTETAKALAQIYFGSENRIIRLDMSEFQSVADIPRLLGSPGEEGLLTTKVKEDPFSLVLLDEIEKAHKNILNLFLQVLDEGHLTDGLGRKIDFKNTIIIATSNAGYKIILEAIKWETEWIKVKQKILDYLFEHGIFRPEFINRFDSVVVFHPLNKENLIAISDLMLQKLKKNLKEKGIEFIITLPLKEKIVELGYNPTFGARQLKRVIQDKVEDILASALLAGEIKRGDKIEINSIFQIEKK